MNARDGGALGLCSQAQSDLFSAIASMRAAMQKNEDPVFGMVILRLIARAAMLERETSSLVGALVERDAQAKRK